MIDGMYEMIWVLGLAWATVFLWLLLQRPKIKAERVYLEVQTALARAQLVHQILETEHLQAHVESIRVQNAMVEKHMHDYHHSHN